MDYVSLIHTEKFSKRRTIFRIGSKLAQLTLSPFDWQIPFPKKIASEMGRTTRYLGQATPSTLDTGSKKYENLIAENVN